MCRPCHWAWKKVTHINEINNQLALSDVNPIDVGAKRSTEEQFIQAMLEYLLGYRFTNTNDREVLDGLEIDLPLYDLKVGFEYDGHQSHYGDNPKYAQARANAIEKRKRANAVGWTIHTITRDVFKGHSPMGYLAIKLREWGLDVVQATLLEFPEGIGIRWGDSFADAPSERKPS